MDIKEFLIAIIKGIIDQQLNLVFIDIAKRSLDMKSGEIINQKRCTSCLLPHSYKSIFFPKSSGGTCNFCLGHKRRIFKGVGMFIQDINLKEGERVGVTVSGGKDSIYVWSRLVELFGLKKVVAFNHSKNGFVHSLAITNLQQMESQLNSELVIVEDEDFQERFKYNFENFLKFPDPAMIKVILCMGCRFGIYGQMFKAGAKRNICKFVEGGSYLERCSFKFDLLEEKGRGSYKQGLLNGLDICGNRNRECVEIDHENWKSPKLFNQKGFLEYDSIQCFNFFQYFENNPDLIKAHVENVYGWSSPKRNWHFDCKMEIINDLLYLSFLGYTENDSNLSMMIRYGLLKRDEAMERIMDINRGIINSKEEVAS